MSTTFGVTAKNGETKSVARRVGGKNGAEIYWTDSMAELLSDDIPVVAIDNTPQGIYTIGDIKSHIRGQRPRPEEVDDEPELESWIKDSSKIEIKQRKSIFVPLDTAWHKEHDFIEVTQWSNGEGWDITISDDKYIALHFTEFEVLKELIQKLEDHE